MSDALAWALALGVLGVLVGSFCAALVIRWPKGRSVVRGRSTCDACDATLGVRDLVPLASALMLRGRCRRCRAAIDPTHWQIELAGGIIGAAAGAALGGPVAIAGAVFGWLLLTLAALDVAAFWLPDRLTGSLAVAGLATGLLGIAPTVTDRLIGGAAGYTSLALIAFAYRRQRGHEGMGGGDPKLFGAIGLWLGWRMLPGVLLFAALTGLGVALIGWMRGRSLARDTRMPFGALLAIAAYPAWLVLLGSSA